MKKSILAVGLVGAGILATGGGEVFAQESEPTTNIESKENTLEIDKSSNLKEEKKGLEAQVSDLNKEKVDLTNSKKELTNQLSDNQKNEAKIKTLNSELDKKKQELQTKKDKLEEDTFNNNLLEKELEKRTSNLTELKNKEKEYTAEKAEQEQEKAELEKQINKETPELKRINDEIAKNQKNIDKKTEDLKVREDYKARLANELDKTNSELDKLKMDRQLAGYDVEGLKKANKELEDSKQPGTTYFGKAKTHISLSPDFVYALKTYMNDQTDENLQKVIEAEKKSEIEPYPTMRVDYDKNEELIDIKNMSQKDKDDLNQYFIHLLNQIRSQFQYPPVKYNTKTAEIAGEISKTIMRDDYRVYGHYEKGISEVAKQYGLASTGNYYENLFNGSIYSKENNMVPKKALYDLTYYFAQRFFYEGTITKPGHYNHAMSLLRTNNGVGISYAIFDKNDNLPFSQVKLSVIDIPFNTIEVDNPQKKSEIYRKNYSNFSDYTVNNLDLSKEKHNSIIIDQIKNNERRLYERQIDFEAANAQVLNKENEVFNIKSLQKTADFYVNRVKEELANLNKIAKDLEDAKNMALSKINKEDTNKDIVEKINKIDRRLKFLNRELADIVKEKAELESSIPELNKVIDREKNNANQLSKEISKAENTISELETERDNISVLKEEKKADIFNKLKNITTRLQVVDSEIIELNNKINKIDEDLNKIEKDKKIQKEIDKIKEEKREELRKNNEIKASDTKVSNNTINNEAKASKQNNYINTGIEDPGMVAGFGVASILASLLSLSFIRRKQK